MKVEEELDHLVQEGILEPVLFSEWAAPIVPVIKPDKILSLIGTPYLGLMICLLPWLVEKVSQSWI